jgi:murein L,D-transpeptidase YcbB/YkuD
LINQKKYGILFEYPCAEQFQIDNCYLTTPILKRLFYLILPVCLFISSCNWFKSTPEIGLVLAEHFKDKRYKDFDTAKYNMAFRSQLDSMAANLNNIKIITEFYAPDERKANLVSRFYVNGQLDTLKAFLLRSNEHGFNPKVFAYQKLVQQLSSLSANKFKSLDEVYPVIARLELYSASSLLKYNTFLGYGSINPRKVLNRYYVTTKRPDKTSMDQVLGNTDLNKLLHDIQPKSENYKTLQRQLLSLRKNGQTDTETTRKLEVNMERLRWQIPVGKEYVEVNIPDYSLTWFNGTDTVTHMKVCVGGRRETNYEEKMKVYQVSHQMDDKPKNHQTPILLSKFNAIQVNPVWNIPVSIAQNEIYVQAMRDPYYLSNNNMKVYYKGRQVNDPDTIQWSRYSRQHLPFQFKQGSGNGNALGKFKFIFDNGSSIYLHDTNNKSAFNRSTRAISHGCVRVEKPLEFAEKLVNDPYQFDQLRMEVNLPPVDTTRMAVYRKKLAKKADTVNVFQLKPKWFGTRKNVYVFINYKTAWTQGGKIEYRDDIYGLDDALYNAMKKYR